ncbi:carbohydrate esterase family 5 protein [Zasmidium cellare ATCC 36951]|uniref:Carbohydrate esterase family 5 protein n=1 Tax=Zasmidium cellare ATCC 36951 TaxID=1080233 RepID=A0A6A6CPW9_ZASCE|nr:carbohydrate esterase family 5 protein [Zasmidium cellare ATCC 36951]KAF2168723.1 carbohydrate esterase family 5 protein [Zasmidium cellare ATCC 36951]
MVLTRHILALATLATSTLAVDCPGADTAGTPCTDGVFVLSARGTDLNFNLPFQNGPNYTEQQGQQDVATALVDKAGGYCRSLPYASSPYLLYFPSINYGIKQGQSTIREYVDRCKSTVNPRIVLLGYSQGGQTMTSVLIGGQGYPTLEDYKQYITGGAFFASPSFVANYPIDGGNSTTSGLFARGPVSYNYFSTTYSNRLRNFCQAGDVFCANAGFSDEAGRIHENAVNAYKQEAIDFLWPLV